MPRDRFKRPLIHVPGTDKPVPYTRCTTFVDCIEDKSALAAWGKRMVLLGATTATAVVGQAADSTREREQEPRSTTLPTGWSSRPAPTPSGARAPACTS